MKATWLYDPKAHAWKDLKANAAAGDFAAERACRPAGENATVHTPSLVQSIRIKADDFNLDGGLDVATANVASNSA